MKIVITFPVFIASSCHADIVHEVEAKILHDLHPPSAEFATWCVHNVVYEYGVDESEWTVSNVETGRNALGRYYICRSEAEAVTCAKRRLRSFGPEELRSLTERHGDPDSTGA